jgi:hypothetical protein
MTPSIEPSNGNNFIWQRGCEQNDIRWEIEAHFQMTGTRREAFPGEVQGRRRCSTLEEHNRFGRDS